MTRLTLPVLKQTPHHMTSQYTIKADQSLDTMLTWLSLSFTPESSSPTHSLLTFFPCAFSRRSSWTLSRRLPWTGSTGHSWCPSWWSSGCFSARCSSWPWWWWWDQEPGKESEMGCLCGLAAWAPPVSWSRSPHSRPHSALSSNTSFSSHLSLGKLFSISEHNKSFEWDPETFHTYS